MDGQVVHARQGLRASYRPIVSSLCPTSEPLAVLEALLRLHPFRTVYLADLNALTGRGRQQAEIANLARRFPRLTFWVDQDARAFTRSHEILFPNRLDVLGSESLDENWRERLATWPAPFALSLDFREDGFVGPRQLLESPAVWPETVILMLLQRVGSRSGPDVALLERQVLAHPETRFIAAGGVRNEEDLRRLERAGAHGALIASALHDGSIRAEDLALFSHIT